MRVLTEKFLCSSCNCCHKCSSTGFVSPSILKLEDAHQVSPCQFPVPEAVKELLFNDDSKVEVRNRCLDDDGMCEKRGFVDGEDEGRRLVGETKSVVQNRGLDDDHDDDEKDEERSYDDGEDEGKRLGDERAEKREFDSQKEDGRSDAEKVEDKRSGEGNQIENILADNEKGEVNGVKGEEKNLDVVKVPKSSLKKPSSFGSNASSSGSKGPGKKRVQWTDDLVEVREFEYNESSDFWYDNSEMRKCVCIIL